MSLRYDAVLHGLFPLLYPAHLRFVDCIDYFCHHCNRISNRSDLKEERVVVDHRLRVGKTQELERHGLWWWELEVWFVHILEDQESERKIDAGPSCDP